MKLRNVWNKSAKYTKSFYYKVMINSFVILIIPILALLVLYGQTERLVKGQINLSSQDRLEQFAQTMDVALDEIKQILQNVAYTDSLEEYINYAISDSKHASYKGILLVEELKKQPIDKFADVFVYYPSINKIVSAKRSTVSPDYYYMAYFDRENALQKEQLEAVLCCESKDPTLYTLEGAGGQELLVAAVCVKHFRDSDKDYVVVSMLPMENIKTFKSEFKAVRDSEIAMYTSKEQLLFFSGTQNLIITREMCAEELTKDIVLDSEKYVMQVKASNSIDCYYGIVTPYYYFWERLKFARMLCAFGILLSCMMGGIVAWRSVKKSYKPVDEMVSLLQKNTETQFDKTIKSEFEFVEEIFVKEKNKLIEQINRNKDNVVEKFCLSLLHGQAKEQKEEDIFEKHGIQLCSDIFLVVAIEVGDNLLADLMNFIVKNVFCELFDKDYKCYVVQISEKRFVILVNLRFETREEELFTILEQGQSFFKETVGVEISMGVGGIATSMMEIREIYERALTTLSYKYLYGRGCLITYEEIKEKGFQYQVYEDSKLYLIMNDYVHGKGTEKNELQIVDMLLKLYGINEMASMETVRCFLGECRRVLSLFIKNQNYAVSEGQGHIDALFEKETFVEFREGVAEILLLLRNRNRDMEKINATCSKTKAYVENHYAEVELSLMTIAEAIDIPARELSKLFKESYGISLLSYIAQIRVQNSKMMLRNTDKNIAEVATLCGFLSDDVFIRTFKKQEGITPGVYRAMMEKSEVK